MASAVWSCRRSSCSVVGQSVDLGLIPPRDRNCAPEHQTGGSLFLRTPCGSDVHAKRDVDLFWGAAASCWAFLIGERYYHHKGIVRGYGDCIF